MGRIKSLANFSNLNDADFRRWVSHYIEELDATINGNLQFGYNIKDNFTLGSVANFPAIKPQITPSSGDYTNSSGTWSTINNMRIAIPTVYEGRGAFMAILPDGSDAALTPATISIAGAQDIAFRWKRTFNNAVTYLGGYKYEFDDGNIYNTPFQFQMYDLDIPITGTYSYELQVNSNAASFRFQYWKMVGWAI